MLDLRQNQLFHEQAHGVGRPRHAEHYPLSVNAGRGAAAHGHGSTKATDAARTVGAPGLRKLNGDSQRHVLPRTALTQLEQAVDLLKHALDTK